MFSKFQRDISKEPVRLFPQELSVHSADLKALLSDPQNGRARGG